MGSYSVLTVGRTTLAWKYRIPTVATFLFEQRDFYQRPDRAPGASDDEERLAIGYRSTVGAVRERLDDLGFTLSFWGGVCDELVDEIDELQLEQVALALAEGDGEANAEAFDARARAHLARPTTRSAANDVAAFIDLLREGIATADGPPGAARVPRFEQESGEIHIDPAELAFSISQEPLGVDPGALRILPLLEHRIEDFPEVADLFLISCLVGAVEPAAVINLDLSQLQDEDYDFSNQPAELAHELLRKLQLYSQVFAVISENEPDIRRRAARGQARQLLPQLESADTADAKGRILEELMAVIFQSHPDLLVSERRLNLGDQEIDLVVDNHVDHGIWKKLDSPFFFVECKNWSAAVGTSEIRDFETKLRDHQPHARLGVLVAVGGFSREARTALARASREPYQLILVTRKDLEELIEAGFDVLSWLERLIAQFG